MRVRAIVAYDPWQTFGCKINETAHETRIVHAHPNTNSSSSSNLDGDSSSIAWLLPYYLGDDDKAVAHAKGVMAASYLDAPATAIYRKSHAKALVARLLALGGYRYDD